MASIPNDMKFLRTPEERFSRLSDFDYQTHYVQIGDGRMHFIDEGKGEVVLCLHGEPSWSYLYRKFIPVLKPQARVICPDLFGFGRSDKPAKLEDYSYEFHFESLKSFLDQLGLRDITLVVQDWGGLLGLGLLGEDPGRFIRVVIMNTTLPVGKHAMNAAFRTWRAFAKSSPIFPIAKIIRSGCARPVSKEAMEAYDAPFPDRHYKAGARAFPLLVPTKADDPGVERMKKAREALSQWTKPALVMFSDKDPIMRGADRWFNENIPSRKGKSTLSISNAGHFLQEDAGEEIAAHIAAFMREK